MHAKTVVRALGALALLATCGGEAEAQIGGIRRAAQRAAEGPSPEVRRLLARIDSTRAKFDRATYLLSQSSLVMEAVVATEERRAQIRRELEGAGTLEQRTGENRVQLNAEDRAANLEQATQQRQFEQRQLSQAQSSNVSVAAFNAALAAVIDVEALNEARQLIGEASSTAQSLTSDPANATAAGRLQRAATTDLPAIVTAVPLQARLASAIAGAAGQARSANQAVQVTEAAPATTAAPRAIDINAI